jgi:phosphatidylglycerol:prolipoprotein diacylglycerol transferase
MQRPIVGATILMWQTLITIPERIGPLPVFGWGWALIVWTVACAITLLAVTKKYGREHALGSVPFSLLVAALLIFVLPMLQVERTLPGGERLYGLPIRGYGVMLMLGVAAGVRLAIHRANQRGLSADVILSLATWMFALGIAGARLLHVVLFWEQYKSPSLWTTIGRILNVPQGGLVVYGSLFCALLAFFLFIRKHKLPGFVLADVIAPSMLLGLCIGRIGCLLNGCCYGGPCDYPWAVQFPPESVPYAEHLRDGSLHGFGFRAEDDTVAIQYVEANSQLGKLGLAAGDVVSRVNGRSLTEAGVAPGDMMVYLVESAGRHLTITTQDGRDLTSSLDQLPARTTPLHPTQLYSSISALALLLFLLACEPYLTRDGQLMTLMIAIYPMIRFLLEVIRTDETSFQSTGMTISQNISLLLLVVAIGMWFYLRKQPAGKRRVIATAI